MAQAKTAKIEKISVVDQVGDEIKDKIISGEWKPGDRLPSEAEIAQMYGVNRLSVRMALQKLITLGVIETRVGEGSFVREFSFFPVLSEMADFMAYGSRMGDIREIRFLIERASALKAAENHSEEDAEALLDALENYCRSVDRYDREPDKKIWHDYVDADLALHIQIVRMSNNLLYLEIYQMIQKLIRLHISSLSEERITHRQSDENDYKELHVKLCEAIISRNRSEIKQVLSVLLNIEPKDEYSI